MVHPRSRNPRTRGFLCVSMAMALAVAGGCGSDSDVAVSESEPTTIATTSTSVQPASTTEAPPELLSMTEGAWIATAVGDGVETFSEPADGPVVWFFPSPTQFGGDRVFLVLDEADDYLQVQLPVRPNGSTGWIRRADVVLSEVTTRAEVNVSDRTLRVWDGDDVLVDTSVAIGKPSTPTPLGRFYVRDIIEKFPSSAYGSYIVGLSGFSEVLETFAGGEPAIAIHGTNRPDLIGQDVSNGCIRIPNELIELMAETVPLGTPVDIVG